MMRLLALCLTLAPASALACAPADLGKLLEAIPTVPTRHRTALSALGLGAACPDWPAPILEGLRGMAQAPPEMSGVLEAKAVAEAPMSWMAACPGGLRAAAKIAELAPAQKRGHLYRACALERFGFASAEEFAASDGALLMPVLIAPLLQKASLPPPSRRLILRALAGISEAGAVTPDPVLERLPKFRVAPEVLRPLPDERP